MCPYWSHRFTSSILVSAFPFFSLFTLPLFKKDFLNLVLPSLQIQPIQLFEPDLFPPLSRFIIFNSSIIWSQQKGLWRRRDQPAAKWVFKSSFKAPLEPLSLVFLMTPHRDFHLLLLLPSNGPCKWVHHGPPSPHQWHLLDLLTSHRSEQKFRNISSWAGWNDWFDTSDTKQGARSLERLEICHRSNQISLIQSYSGLRFIFMAVSNYEYFPKWHIFF